MPSEESLASLTLLQERLHRLEFTLAGSDRQDELSRAAPESSGDMTVAARLAKLEDDFKKLSSRSTLAQDVMKLCRLSGHLRQFPSKAHETIILDSRHPDLFEPSDTAAPKNADAGMLTSIVLAHATQFPETASRLSSMQTLPVPQAADSAHLIGLKSRIETAVETQIRQEDEIADLTIRSARLLEWWVNVAVVGMNECWADWEARVRDCARATTILEGKMSRDES